MKKNLYITILISVVAMVSLYVAVFAYPGKTAHAAIVPYSVQCSAVGNSCSASAYSNGVNGYCEASDPDQCCTISGSSTVQICISGSCQPTQGPDGKTTCTLNCDLVGNPLHTNTIPASVAIAGNTSPCK